MEFYIEIWEEDEDGDFDTRHEDGKIIPYAESSESIEKIDEYLQSEGIELDDYDKQQIIYEFFDVEEGLADEFTIKYEEQIEIKIALSWEDPDADRDPPEAYGRHH